MPRSLFGIAGLLLAVLSTVVAGIAYRWFPWFPYDVLYALPALPLLVPAWFCFKKAGWIDTGRRSLDGKILLQKPWALAGCVPLGA